MKERQMWVAFAEVQSISAQPCGIPQASFRIRNTIITVKDLVCILGECSTHVMKLWNFVKESEEEAAILFPLSMSINHLLLSTHPIPPKHVFLEEPANILHGLLTLFYICWMYHL